MTFAELAVGAVFTVNQHKMRKRSSRTADSFLAGHWFYVGLREQVQLCKC